MLSERFKRMIQPALENEGVRKNSSAGYINDPYDVGGKTIFGIASKFWKEEYKVIADLYRRGLKSIAWDYALEFYNSHFWNHLYDEIEDESLCFKLFDFGINASPKTAVRILQETSNKIFSMRLKVDGIFGKLTLNAVNAATMSLPNTPRAVATFIQELKREEINPDESLLYSLYCLNIKEYYQTRKTFWRFGRGWLNRLRKVYNESIDASGKIKWSLAISKFF